VAGYTRQSTADIIPTATVRAAPLNAEYNAIRDAFAASGGHKHDGTAAEGEYVPLISDLDNYNKVVIDSTNNRVGVFVEVSAAAVEQVRFQDGAIVPVTTNDIDLGTSLLKFKNLYIEGTATIGDVSLAGGTIDDTVIGGTTPAAGTFTSLTATTVDLNGGNIDGTIIGATTAAAADFTTMDASGNATVGGTLGVTGNTTIGGTLGVTGVTTLGTANITSVDLDSGAIDNTTIGASTPAAGTFTVLTANTSLTAATADINGGTLDGVTIGGTTSAAATVTDLTATGTSTLSTVDINAGAIDGTTIGASSHTTGKFTTLQSTGLATLNSVNIDGGNIDGTVIGNTTAAAITGTTITGTSFVGPVTGNVTGNLTGDVTGDLTGDVTGNITSSGSSSFNNVTIDGTLNMNAGTTATITNLSTPVASGDAASKGYVDTEIANLVDSAPGTLDTLNELAAALGDDPNFSTTITNSIATKLPLAGGTMTGAIAMSTNKITGLGDPTAAQDAMTKAYADATYLALSGGTMTGAIDMGSQKITTTYTPTNAADLTTKTYVDGILGSATAASASAAAAATSETNAATSETNAATSETNAAASATSAATLYDNFDDRYLGAKASAPTLDNDGDALIIGALYFDTTTDTMKVYGSSGWAAAGSSVNGTSDRQTYTATSGQTVFAATYDAGYVDVYLNGVKLLVGTDFTATNGTSITLASGAAVNDIVDIVAYGTFVLADHYTKTQSDARYVEVAGDTMTGTLNGTSAVFSGDLTVDTNTLYVDSTNNNVGIATSSPMVALNVHDSTNARIALTNSSTGQTFPDGFELLATGLDAYVQNRSNGNMVFTTNNTEAARIDASGNLLVGKTSTSSTTAGGNIFGGLGSFVRDGNTPLSLNRRTNDGEIVSFAAQDGVVGTIGAVSTELYIGTGSTGLYFDASNTAIKPRNVSSGTGSATDGNIDLGGTGNRFKDLYLSGTAYVSGSGVVGRFGNTTANNYVEVIRTTTNPAYVTIAATSAAASIQGGPILKFLITDADGTNGSEVARFDSSGNFGIGTSSTSLGRLTVLQDYASNADTLVLKSPGASGGGSQSGIKFVRNTDATLAQVYADTNSGAFITNVGGSEAMRISSTGKVGINNTSPVEDLHIKGTNPRINVEGDGSSYYPSIRVTGINGGISLGTYYGGNISGENGIAFLTGSSATDGGTRRMTLSSGGGLSVGTTGLPTSGNAGVSLQPAGNVHCGVAGTAATDVMRFDNPNGRIGSITVTGTTTSYNTSSDYRLKENVTDVTDGITRVKQLAPKRFNFIADPDTTVDGFIAHEVQDVIPEAISGTKDAMRDEEYEVTPAVEATFDEEGNVLTEAVEAVMGTRSVPDYQGIDQAKLVPLLTAALQEAIAKIEDLEARVAALET
jgi:fibronectin-binding autotransporter adhesin